MFVASERSGSAAINTAGLFGSEQGPHGSRCVKVGEEGRGHHSMLQRAAVRVVLGGAEKPPQIASS